MSLNLVSEKAQVAKPVDDDDKEALLQKEAKPPLEAKPVEGEASFTTQAFWLLVWMAK